MGSAKKAKAGPGDRRAAAERNARPLAAAAFVDKRPEAVAQRSSALAINHSARATAQRKLNADIRDSAYVVAQQKQLDGIFGKVAQLERGPEEEEPLQGKFHSVQRQESEEEEPLQGKFQPVQRQSMAEEEELLQGKLATVQRETLEEEEPLQGRVSNDVAAAQRGGHSGKPENRTGMPDRLRTGLEDLSGKDLSGVRVHYGSAKPAQYQAHAYTQGRDIHVAPGQERYLPHEGWHAVQQKQGRVEPTTRMKDGVPVNDDEKLEHEADVMGTKALALTPKTAKSPSSETHPQGSVQKPPAPKPQSRKLGAGRQSMRVSPTPEKPKSKPVVLDNKVKEDFFFRFVTPEPYYAMARKKSRSVEEFINRVCKQKKLELDKSAREQLAAYVQERDSKCKVITYDEAVARLVAKAENEALAVKYMKELRGIDFGRQRKPAVIFGPAATTGHFNTTYNVITLDSEKLPTADEQLDTLLFESQNAKQKTKLTEAKRSARKGATASIEYDTDRMYVEGLLAIYGCKDYAALVKKLDIPEELLEFATYKADTQVSMPDRDILGAQDMRQALWWYKTSKWNDQQRKAIWMFSKHGVGMGSSVETYE